MDDLKQLYRSGRLQETAAAARIDWRSFLEACPMRLRTIVEALAEGGSTREAGRSLRLRDSAAGSLRRSLAVALFEFFGPEAVEHVLKGCPVAWRSSVNAEREKHLGRSAGAAHVGWAAAS